jgi:hypothetical protein
MTKLEAVVKTLSESPELRAWYENQHGLTVEALEDPFHEGFDGWLLDAVIVNGKDRRIIQFDQPNEKG